MEDISRVSINGTAVIFKAFRNNPWAETKPTFLTASAWPPSLPPAVVHRIPTPHATRHPAWRLRQECQTWNKSAFITNATKSTQASILTG